jgi:hypothetical protein
MVGATVGILLPSLRDMPRGFARYATAGRFWRILLRPGFKSIIISHCDSRDMPIVTPTIARSANTRLWIRCRVVAKSAGFEDPVFTSTGTLTCYLMISPPWPSWSTWRTSLVTCQLSGLPSRVLLPPIISLGPPAFSGKPAWIVLQLECF